MLTLSLYVYGSNSTQYYELCGQSEWLNIGGSVLVSVFPACLKSNSWDGLKTGESFFCTLIPTKRQWNLASAITLPIKMKMTNSADQARLHIFVKSPHVMQRWVCRVNR